jgi:hypothetical protein
MTDDDVLAYLMGDTDITPATADSARLEQARELLAQPALWVEPNPDLQQRVVAAVTAAATTSNPNVGVVDHGGTQGIALGRRRRPRWIRNTILAVAAAVLLGVGVGVAALSSGHPRRPMEYAASLSGTPLAPGAGGSVTLTKTGSGWRIHLTATGLPRLDNGRYYQGWLKNAAGILVPIGTFNQATDVTLWAGVPPNDYPTITITRQQAGGGPASSGQKVLTGLSHRTH